MTAEKQPRPSDEPIELDLPAAPAPPARATEPVVPRPPSNAALRPISLEGLERRRPQGAAAGLARGIALVAGAIVRATSFGVSRARLHGGKALADFQQRPEHTRWRAYAFGAYALACALTFTFQLWEPNSLSAYVLVQSVALPESTVIFVRNDSKKTWREVRITLNDLYGYQRNELTPGSHVQLSVDRFAIVDTNGKGTYAPKNLNLTRITVDCDRGHYEKEFTK